MTTITRSEQYSDGILNTDEAAEYLHMSASTLTRMRRRYILRMELEVELLEKGGKSPELKVAERLSEAIGPKFVRFGKKVFYRREDLEDWKRRPI